MKDLSGLLPETPPAINLTPLLDIVFQLIIFLVLGANFVLEPALEINLPSTDAAAVPRPDIPRITITRTGTLSWNARSVEGTEYLGGELDRYAAEHPAGPVQIMADEEAPYRSIVTVIDLCGARGLSNMILGMEKADP